MPTPCLKGQRNSFGGSGKLQLYYRSHRKSKNICSTFIFVRFSISEARVCGKKRLTLEGAHLSCLKLSSADGPTYFLVKKEQLGLAELRPTFSNPHHLNIQTASLQLFKKGEWLLKEPLGDEARWVAEQEGTPAPEYALTLEGEGVLSAATEEMPFQGKGTETTAKSKEGQASGWDIKTQC